MKEIKTKAAYDKVMCELFNLMNTDEAKVIVVKSKRIKELNLAAQKYEQELYKLI